MDSQRERQTHLIEKLEFTMEIGNVHDLSEEIVSAKFELVNIVAEW